MDISIQNLAKCYSRGKYAIRDITLDIPAGLFGLLGPNGAGKTTLMRILVTLLKPTEGSISIKGMDISKERREIRKLIGYLPQDFKTFSKLSVWEFLDYTACLNRIRSHTERREIIEKLLEEVGLSSARDRRADKLSGGMKRRLGIAQTLIGNPRIMVIDEPTVGLDPQERIRFRNLLSDISRQETTIILSTHIVGDISSTCTKIALMDSGNIIYHGAPEKLIEMAQGKVWRIYADDLELDELREQYHVISTLPSESGYEVRVVAEENPNQKARPQEPNLEDAYIYYMQRQGSGVDIPTNNQLNTN